MESADVVIAGGGIIGCALAYQLSKRNVDVLLLERETLGSQSTGKCAGGVRQQFSSEGNARLQMMSVGMLERFDEEIGHPWGKSPGPPGLGPFPKCKSLFWFHFFPPRGIPTPGEVAPGLCGPRPP